MMRAVVDQVAALTKAAQVAQPIVGRIMIQVRGGKHDMCCPHPNDLLQIRPTSDASPPVAPRLPHLIVPSPIRQAAHSGAMWPAAALAHAAGALETNPPAELAPMSRIQVAELAGSAWPQDLAYFERRWLQHIVPHQQLSRAVFCGGSSALAPQRGLGGREGLHLDG